MKKLYILVGCENGSSLADGSATMGSVEFKEAERVSVNNFIDKLYFWVHCASVATKIIIAL